MPTTPNPQTDSDSPASDALCPYCNLDKYEHPGFDFERCVKNIREVTIPACENHDGFSRVTVKLLWICPTCKEPRGEVYDTRSYDGSRILDCDGWRNPCGHVDKYTDVRLEARVNGLNGGAS